MNYEGIQVSIKIRPALHDDWSLCFLTTVTQWGDKPIRFGAIARPLKFTMCHVHRAIIYPKSER